jgi:competence protein ComEC
VCAFGICVAQGFLIGLSGVADHPELADHHMRRVAVVGTVIGPPRERRGSVRFALKTDRILIDTLWHSHPASLLATVTWGSRDSIRPQIRYGDRVAVSGMLRLPSPPRNPGEPDFRQWYRANGFSHDLVARGAPSVRLLGEGDVPLFQRHVVQPLRGSAVAALEAGYTGQAGEFLKGLLLGVRDGIDRDTQEAFVNAGVAHILAVSGSNVALVAAIALFLLGLLRFPRRIVSIPVVLALLLYMLVTGSQPPVVRATLMALLVIGGRAVQRRVSGLNVIGIAALAALVESPLLILDAGFQLSFAAVLALVLAYPALDRKILAMRIHRLIRTPLVWTLRLAGISFAATIGTLPLTALSFGRLSVVGVLANIPVVPLSGGAVVLGAASLLCRWIAPGLAPGFEAVNSLILELTLLITRTAGGLPWASVDTSSWTVVEVVPFIAGAGAALSPPASLFRRVLSLLALGALALIALLARPAFFVPPSRTLTVSVVDVGQGDAILLQFPDGISMLVDAGPGPPAFDAGARVVAPLLERLGVERLTYLVLTHAHADHAGGVPGLLRSVAVDTVLASGPADLGGRAIPQLQPAAGASFAPTPDARVYVLWPGVDELPGRRVNGNNRSIILKVVFGKFSVLLTGDGEAVVERLLVERYGGFVRSTVLKVGHHGSSSGSSARFLGEVRPELAVISVGSMNRFGHPSAEVILRLGEMECPVRRTDADGCVMIRTDGRTWERVEWRR